ncbi:MAG TPA: hypothetical protein VGM06_01150 [Polyangiaceae bacterium]|jgi:hypothetical protein
MLRSLAPLAFVVLLAPEVLAEESAAPAGRAPTQAEIDEAVHQYFTNGAAVMSVPSSGPAADYFRNGASVTSVPTSGPGAAYFQNGAEVTAYRDPEESPIMEAPAPPTTPPVPSSAPTGSSTATTGSPGVTPLPTANGSSSPRPVAVPTMTPAGPPVSTPSSEAPADDHTDTPAGTPSRPEPSGTSALASPAAPTTAGEPTGALAVERSVESSFDVLRLARLFPALGGALLGGLAIVFLSRARSPKERAKDDS